MGDPRDRGQDGKVLSAIKEAVHLVECILPPSDAKEALLRHLTAACREMNSVMAEVN